ncbi:glycosyltransferase family 4 protein [Actinoplanes sp. URMC 104]|uniref:glycosyltransferase family 4 protein n=1 Tax=Actinoplanes sp. URMC 104 TaxID=3423409 RepID=UPI003F1D7819
MGTTLAVVGGRCLPQHIQNTQGIGQRVTLDVLMLTNAIPPDQFGGLERYVRELAAALSRAGVRTGIVAKRVSPSSPDVEMSDDGVHLFRHDVPSKSSKTFAVRYPVRTWRSIRSILAEHPRAVLHGHFPIPVMPLVKPFASVERPFLYTLHGAVHTELLRERQGSYALPKLVQGPVVEGLRRVEASVVSRASTVVVLSEYMRTVLAQLSVRSAANARVVPGGVNTACFRPNLTSRSSSDPLMFTARRLTSGKGVTELVAAMATVVERHPRARLAIAGDGPLRPRIEADIAARNLHKNIELLGRLGDDDLRAWYNRATLTVVPTTDPEPFGLATAESLLCGTPVLVTPAGGSPELVRGLGPRFVTPTADSAGLAQGILDLLDTPEALDQARRSLPGDLPIRWSWDTVAAHYATMYETLR